MDEQNKINANDLAKAVGSMRLITASVANLTTQFCQMAETINLFRNALGEISSLKADQFDDELDMAWEMRKIADEAIKKVDT